MQSAPDHLETKSAQPRLLDRFPDIEEAVETLDVTGLPGWRKVTEIFPGASFDGLTVYLSAIVEREDGRGFVAPADIDLLINEGAAEFEESCPARVMIELVQGSTVIIDVVPETGFAVDR